MKTVAYHWRYQKDWRQWEALLNSFSNYNTALGGQMVHFILEPGSGACPVPLLLTHGWPGSVVEFIDVIKKLAHPERSGGGWRPPLLSWSRACLVTGSRTLQNV